MDSDIWRAISLSMSIFLGCVGLIINSFYIYVVATQSHTAIQRYKIILYNTIINDMLLSLLIIFLAPRVIGVEWNFIMTSRGICNLIGTGACSVGAFVLFANLSHRFFSLIIMFAYRLYVIRHPIPTVTTMIFILLCILLPSALQIAFGIVYTVYMPKRNELIKSLNGLGAISENELVFGLNHILDWRVLYCITILLIPIIPVYIGIYFLRKRAVYGLKIFAISSKTVRVQAEQLQVLSKQVYLPLLFVISIGMYAFELTTNWSHVTFESLIIFPLSLIPILTPLIPMYYVPSYRSWVKWHAGGMCRKTSTIALVPRKPFTISEIV